MHYDDFSRFWALAGDILRHRRCHALVHIPSYRLGARAARAGCPLRQRRSD